MAAGPSAAMPVGSGDWMVEAIAGAVLVAALGCIAVLIPSITRQRDSLQLVVSMEGTKGMPPHVALATAALGTFRGLAVDVLWIRAEELQNKGDYFEAQTLAEWITTLQPRFVNVWDFQAHNMAYNISVRAEDPFERWGWVSRGMELLRTRGIPLNPQSPKLYEELGWILMNKIGGKLDREHWYLKARLASEMQEVLGDKSTGRTADESIAAMTVVADAPDSVEEVLRRQPDVQRVLDLLAANNASPDEEFLRSLGLVLMVDSSTDAKILAGAGLPAGVNKPLILALKQDAELARLCFQHLIPTLQKSVLRDRYRMEASRMVALMKQYGPMDWRHPSAQGIYWMEEATSRIFEARNRANRDELVLVRRRLNMIAELMRNGRIHYDAMSDKIDLLPDPRFISSYETALGDAIQLVSSEQGVETQHWGRAQVSDLMKHYERFLHEAVVLSFVYGDEAMAQRCYRKLLMMAQEGGYDDQPIFRDGIEMFVALRLGEIMKLDVSNTRQFVDGMLNRALVDGLAMGRLDVFNRFLKMAYRVYDKKYSVSDPSQLRVQKFVAIGSFPELVDTSFQRLMTQGSETVMMRARIWAWAPDELKLRAWPKIKKSLEDQATAADLDPARAFPMPQGYVEEKQDADAVKPTPTPTNPAAKAGADAT